MLSSEKCYRGDNTVGIQAVRVRSVFGVITRCVFRQFE